MIGQDGIRIALVVGMIRWIPLLLLLLPYLMVDVIVFSLPRARSLGNMGHCINSIVQTST